MTMAINIPDQLVSKISEAAKKRGFTKADDFVTRLIEEKLVELEEQESIFAVTDQVRARLKAQGISEEQTLADFERFRERLYHERSQGKNRD